ncbi:GtrA family protein [Tabrizicola sp.]|uniref:GtrA family protein n=1 Tax=Tabrizicola sp. TaxID=2005166 RepID=UPI0027343BE7|nr:GtrA family protein [Tabrizicola sp.]MDP3193950.1 GtrA family protein [Tabrizicola sp.]
MNTFARFLLVGGALALVYAVVAALATSQLPWPTAVSAGAAWVACIPLGFWCHRRFTFTGSARRPFALGLYALTQVLGIGIGAGVSFLFATGRFWPDFPVHLCASALAAVASYVINRKLTFPESGSA